MGFKCQILVVSVPSNAVMHLLSFVQSTEEEGEPSKRLD